MPTSPSAPAESADGAGRPRVGYLGPEGTFTEEALLSSAEPGAVQPVALRTIYDTVLALTRGAVEWAIVPIENSLDGSVSVTLDLLAGEGGPEIVGEVLLSVRHSLIAGEAVELDQIATVLTHPQVPGQCERLLRGELAHAKVLPASSTAEAVRIVVGEGRRTQAALGTVLAGEIYGGTVIREGVQDRDDNETRFVWLARSREAVPGTREGPPLRSREEGEWKTSLVFWGPGADSPGWLVQCLDEFGRRAINLTKIESRPRRERMGSYMFFVDLQGRMGEPAVAQAVAGLREICAEARVLGSYRSGHARGETPPDARGTENYATSDRHECSAPPLHSGATDG
jgi:prephenate dehydratase